MPFSFADHLDSMQAKADKDLEAPCTTIKHFKRLPSHPITFDALCSRQSTPEPEEKVTISLPNKMNKTALTTRP